MGDTGFLRARESGKMNPESPLRPIGGLTVWVRISLVCLVIIALWVLPASARPDVAVITPDELLAGVPLAVEEDSVAIVDNEEVLAVNAEMREFLVSHVGRRVSDYIKLHELLHAIINEGTFGLEYDETTRTATQTFVLRQGNCLSFSNMFVAMAREVGLDVEFQEVDIPPDWTYRNDAFVLNRHVNVLVDLGTAGDQAVDFNIDDFRTSYDRRTISDQRALAHYFNNMGVERMQVGDTTSALLYFRRAIAENDRGFSPAWANLGILYLREDHPAYAEAAFLEAVKANPGDYVAMSNLVSLYELQGNQERAEDYRKKVIRHRNQNPYYRYQLARDAFFAQDYDAAINHLKYAIRKRKQEDQFCFLLGLAYLQKGNEGAARRWFARAEEIAATDALKRNYSNKIDMLLSATD
jgi:tetratricopeptide (TPR) repeat protein